jgi:hypothetical protein
MNQISNNTTITADGDYALPLLAHGTKGLLQWRVEAGSATVTPGFVNLGGVFTAAHGLEGEEFSFPAEGGMVVMDVPPESGQLALRVADASVSPALALKAFAGQAVTRAF